MVNGSWTNGRPFYEDILCKCEDDNLLQIPIVRKKLGISRKDSLEEIGTSSLITIFSVPFDILSSR